MRALLVALSVPDPASLRAALQAALGATSVDLCQAPEAAVTWLENRPCDLVAVAGQDGAFAEAVTRLRRVSRTIPLLALVPEASSREAGAAWLAGADDVVGMSALVAGMALEGLDEVRHPERDVLRRLQRLWYAGTGDTLRQQLAARLGARFREVGLTAEGLVGLTTQDVESPQSAALVVNAAAEPEALVLGVRRVKRTYPGLAVVVLAHAGLHDAFRRAGADECIAAAGEADDVMHAVARAQAACRAVLELDVVRARETRLRALVEHLPEAVMLVSPEHSVLAVNLAALRLLGAQDARQVLGSPLAPWLDINHDQLDAAVALVDGVASGATRELFTRTRHLADPRRLLLRAVPFQRESGGAPAALIVLREAAETPAIDDVRALPAVDVDADAVRAVDAAHDAERQAWDAERGDLQARLDALSRAAEALGRELDDARAELKAAADRAATPVAAAPLEILGVTIEDVPALLEVAARLRVLEQEEIPSLLAQAQAEQAAHADEVARLRDTIAALEARGAQDDRMAALEAAATRLQEIENRELPSLQRAIEAARAERDAAAREADEARRRVAMLQAELERAHDDHVVAPAPVDTSDVHRWMLEDVARVGIVRTTSDGRVIEANDHAARLCGMSGAPALLAARQLPEGLGALAEDADMQGPVRFETCLQALDAPPRWIVGARLRGLDGADDVTWLLAETHAPTSRQAGAPSDPLRAVLEAVADEYAVLVEHTPAVTRGPRAVESTPREAEPGSALARARVLLAQVSAFRRRQGDGPAVDDLAARLSLLDPLLARLATDDITWSSSWPTAPVHVCVAPSDLERALTGLVAVLRDGLPLGGRLTLSVGSPRLEAEAEPGAVRRPVVGLHLDAQGYGVQSPAMPAMLEDLLSRMGVIVETSQPDALTVRVALQVPRAIVIAHAAA